MSQSQQQLPKDVSLNNIVSDNIVVKKGSFGEIVVNGLGAREVDVVSLTVEDELIAATLTASNLNIVTINGDAYPPETGNVIVDPLNPVLTGERVVIGANSDNQIRTADGVYITGEGADGLNVNSNVSIGLGLNVIGLRAPNVGAGNQSFRFPVQATTTGQLLAANGLAGSTSYSSLIVDPSTNVVTSTFIHNNATISAASGIASGTQPLTSTGGLNCTLVDDNKNDYMWTKVGKILTVSGYASLNIAAPGAYSIAFNLPTDLVVKGNALPNRHRIGCTLYNVSSTELPPFIFPDALVPTNVLKLQGTLTGAGQIVELCFSGQLLLD